MNEQPEISKVEKRARELFDDSLERIDARTRSRLTQARHAALDELKSTRGLVTRWIWAPVGGLAAAAVIAVLVTGRPSVDPAVSSAPSPEELEIVAGDESVELLQDVEFYAWLAQQPNSG